MPHHSGSDAAPWAPGLRHGDQVLTRRTFVQAFQSHQSLDHAEIIHHGGGSDRVAADKMIKLLRAKAQLYWKHWSALSAWLESTKTAA